MKTISTLSILGAISLFTTPGKAQTPTVRYENPSIRPNYISTGGNISHRGGDFDVQSYTSFSFQTDEKLTQFQWRGPFYEEDLEWGELHSAPSADAGEWEVSIWSDKNGALGEQLYVETLPGSQVERTFAVMNDYLDGALSFYDFVFDFSSPFEASSNTTYWISTVYLSNTEWPRFFWGWGAATDELSVPQMSLAAVQRPRMNTLLKVHHDGSRTVDWNFHWQRGTAQAIMKLLTIPSNDGDADGIDDAWENAHRLDTASDSASADPDGDGSTNLEEFARKTDPNNPDSDGDGLSDGVETGTGVYEGPTNTGTHPLLEDSDFDGLSDSNEVPDEAPLLAGHVATDPTQRDTDKDGYADLLELDQGLNPLDANSFPAIQIIDELIGHDLTDPEDDGILSSEFFNFGGTGDPDIWEGGHLDLFDNEKGQSGADWKSGPLLFASVELPAAYVIDKFTMTSARNNPQLDPLSWELQGSNDGENFHTIFHRENSFESVWTERAQVVLFEAGVHYTKPPAFRFFRFATNLEEGTGEEPTEDTGSVQIGEIELFGTEYQLAVSEIRRSQDGNSSISWHSLPGNTYTIESSVDLKNWQEEVDGIVADGWLTTATIEVFKENPTGYFRVIEE